MEETRDVAGAAGHVADLAVVASLVGESGEQRLINRFVAEFLKNVGTVIGSEPIVVSTDVLDEMSLHLNRGTLRTGRRRFRNACDSGGFCRPASLRGGPCRSGPWRTWRDRVRRRVPGVASSWCGQPRRCRIRSPGGN